MRGLITGGVGFIGSQLCKALMELNYEVTILDNFSSGTLSNIQGLSNFPRETSLIRGDCKNPHDVKRALSGVQTVFHFAANPEVRLDHSDPSTCFQENVYATHVLLEELRESDVSSFVFASSSTVYGEAKLVPTPESYGPMEPISIYGASKLASEALVAAYSHTYGISAIILRFANIVGPKSKHGVINDLLAQIKTRPRRLRILGDGHQAKSYLHIDDCVSGITSAIQAAQEIVNVFNIGSEDQIKVKKIAEIIARHVDLDDSILEFSAGGDGGRGWNGDVKNMLLDVTKLKSTGWRPNNSSEQAVESTIKSALAGFGEHEVSSKIRSQ